MMFALIALVATLQAKGPDVQPVSAPAPVSQPAPAPAPVVVEEPVAEPEFVEEAPLPTRQVCRYVEVSGSRFPVRRCRTVTIYPED
ncbi:hypothetical protein [Brevundimonas sp.]|jgi:hypothetical protein|uniref:hypothetical protein n=1 Tax=Brevundimonas sp. TaxID=1871086 RepID=UPI0037850C63